MPLNMRTATPEQLVAWKEWEKRALENDRRMCDDDASASLRGFFNCIRNGLESGFPWCCILFYTWHSWRGTRWDVPMVDGFDWMPCWFHARSKPVRHPRWEELNPPPSNITLDELMKQHADLFPAPVGLTKEPARRAAINIVGLYDEILEGRIRPMDDRAVDVVTDMIRPWVLTAENQALERAAEIADQVRSDWDPNEFPSGNQAAESIAVGIRAIKLVIKHEVKP